MRLELPVCTFCPSSNTSWVGHDISECRSCNFGYFYDVFCELTTEIPPTVRHLKKQQNNSTQKGLIWNQFWWYKAVNGYCYDEWWNWNLDEIHDFQTTFSDDDWIIPCTPTLYTSIIIIITMGRMGICFTSVATSWWGEACCLLLCFPTGTWVLRCT